MSIYLHMKVACHKTVRFCLSNFSLLVKTDWSIMQANCLLKR